MQIYTQSLDLAKAIHSQSGTSLIRNSLKERIRVNNEKTRRPRYNFVVALALKLEDLIVDDKF